MKKSLLFFLVLSLNLFSQNHRFFYDFQYKIDSLKTEARDVLVLLISDKENLFLSNRFVETDSINSITTYEKQSITPQYNSIIRYDKENQVFSSYKKLDLDYYNYEFKNNINWKILPETKEILGFRVQKATTEYGGRNWTVWFCQDIKFPFGPYVFYGLPGLVLEVYDDDDNFHFLLIKNLNSFSHQFQLDNIFERKPNKINKDEWKKIQLNYYSNPLYNYKTIGWTIFNKDGSPYTDQDYRALELKRKEEIKRYNNPIELSDKVIYK